MLRVALWVCGDTVSKLYGAETELEILAKPANGSQWLCFKVHLTPVRLFFYLKVIMFIRTSAKK